MFRSQWALPSNVGAISYSPLMISWMYHQVVVWWLQKFIQLLRWASTAKASWKKRFPVRWWAQWAEKSAGGAKTIDQLVTLGESVVWHCMYTYIYMCVCIIICIYICIYIWSIYTYSIRSIWNGLIAIFDYLARRRVFSSIAPKRQAPLRLGISRSLEDWSSPEP